MKYQEALEYMDEVKERGSVSGAESLKELCRRLGNPEEGLRFIHVDETGGREEILVYVVSVMKCAGYKVGRLGAPVLGDDRERIAVNGRAITKAGFCECLEEVKEAVCQMETEGHVPPGAVDIETTVAYLYFKKCGCQFVLVEKEGEGTERISIFHKPETEELKRVKYGLEKQRFTYGEYKDLMIGMAGLEQPENAAFAVEVIKRLGEMGFPVTEGQLRKGLQQAVWKGSFYMIGKKPFFIIDGADGGESAKRLAASVRYYFKDRKIICIMGAARDSDYEGMTRAVCELAEHVVTVTPKGEPEALHAYELAQEAQHYHPSVTAVDSPEEAAEVGKLLAGKDGVIVAVGSLRYLGFYLFSATAASASSNVVT